MIFAGVLCRMIPSAGNAYVYTYIR